MFKFLKKLPYWYLIAIPLLAYSLGTVSNQAVIWANGDKFPVLYNNEKIHNSCQTPDSNDDKNFISLIVGHKNSVAPSAQSAPKTIDSDLCQNGGEFLDDTHTIMNKNSRLTFLADIFDFDAHTYSVGDFLILFGEWMWKWAGIAWLALIIRKFVEA